MRGRSLLVAVAAAVSAVTVSGPALAAGLPAVVMMDTRSDQAEADRAFVRWLSTDDYRPEVRSAARAALLSSAGDAAIAAFLATGYDAAVARAERTRQRNVDFANRMVLTHPADRYPWVNAAGRWALQGTDAELAEFAKTGYAAALERDKKNIEFEAGEAAKVRQEDRDFVVRLRDGDPGAQVRAWAGRAVAEGSTDADVAEFLTHGWVSAAGLDLQMHRKRCADEDARWRATTNRLVIEAQAAEKAARETVGEAQEQARAAAARAWATVGAQTGAPRLAWAQAQQVAQKQADTWQQVSQAAGSATSPNWQAIADTAQGTREQWLEEQKNAAAQAASWTALYEQALAAEQALNTPATPTA
ncbi:hypothetical protein [Couchioplanes caeruleus]|nr:hypothetical protein [Couchioplanes caeruleus]ROP30397.1 hypothetical protein EDD30_3242 [Couchioplanes caeruleus]